MAPWIFADSLLHDKQITLFNGGQMLRDFTYIDDVVYSIIKVIEKERSSNYEIYNIGCSKPYPVRYLLELMEKEYGKQANVISKEKNNADMLNTYANMQKFFADYGYDKAFTEFGSGVTKFCTWLKDYLKVNE